MLSDCCHGDFEENPVTHRLRVAGRWKNGRSPKRLVRFVAMATTQCSPSPLVFLIYIVGNATSKGPSQKSLQYMFFLPTVAIGGALQNPKTGRLALTWLVGLDQCLFSSETAPDEEHRRGPRGDVSDSPAVPSQRWKKNALGRSCKKDAKLGK